MCACVCSVRVIVRCGGSPHSGETITNEKLENEAPKVEKSSVCNDRHKAAPSMMPLVSKNSKKVERNVKVGC